MISGFGRGSQRAGAEIGAGPDLYTAYYYCKNTRGETGHRCSFRTNLEQMEIDRYVAAIISAMVHDKQFEEAIRKKIGKAVNTDDLEKELDAVKNQLRQMLAIKNRLENQMDTLDVSDPHYERKILGLQCRYDDQHDKIAEAELQTEDIRKRIRTIRSEQISGEDVYQLLLAFDELYGGMDEPGKKELLRAIIERIDLLPYSMRLTAGSSGGSKKITTA